MIETAYLASITAYFRQAGVLTPVPATIGVVDPEQADQLPALVLSIEQAGRLGTGLGERTAVATGALPWTAKIDLANPVLPGDPSFHLLSDDRRSLSLPHGGLVRADGSTGIASAADIQASLPDQNFVLKNAAPGAGEFTADLLGGLLTFGAALPAAGVLTVHYFIGQWERRVLRMAGQLRADVLAADSAAAQALSEAVLEALDAAASSVAGLASIAPKQIGSVQATPPGSIAARQRVLYFDFQFDLEINQPDTSGGIIRQIPVNALLG
jgi:hypothetical protein